MNIDLSAEQIQKNWKKFNSLLDNIGDDRRNSVKFMVDDLGERLCLAPASSRTSFHNCMPGGLVDHSLRVLKNSMIICKAFSWEFPLESLVISSLFHDLGKVGDHEQDYYIPNDSSWHVNQLGARYKYNEKLQFMTNQDRSIFLMCHYQIKLTSDEFLAIRLNDGQYTDTNKDYMLKEPFLATVIHHADLIAVKQEKENFLLNKES